MKFNIFPDCLKNAVHGAESPEVALREINFFFPTDGSRRLQNTACFSDVTCGVIKPHVVLDGMYDAMQVLKIKLTELEI